MVRWYRVEIVRGNIGISARLRAGALSLLHTYIIAVSALSN